MSYANLNEDLTFFKKRTEDEEFETLKYKTEKLDYEKFFNPVSIDKEYFNKTKQQTQ